VEASPEGADASGDGGEEVGAGGGNHADGGGGAVLFMVGMEHEEEVDGFGDLGPCLVVDVWQGEHHVQEVGDVSAVGIGVDKGLAACHFVGEGGDSTDFGEKSGAEVLDPVVGDDIAQVSEFAVVATKGVDHGGKHSHGVGIGGETFEVAFEVFMDKGIVGE